MNGKTIPADSGNSWRMRLRRPSLMLGLITGFATFAAFFFASRTSAGMCFIAAWDAGSCVALIAMYLRLRGATAEEMTQNAIRQDAGKWAVLVTTLLAATASLVVITAEIPVIKNSIGLEKTLGVVLVIFTVALSWGFVQTMFALHYAHDHYFQPEGEVSPGIPTAERLIFPKTELPTYSDFLYFAFTVGMTFQVSDVQVADGAMRRLVLLHGVVAFFYTTGILALAINLVAGLI